MAAADSPFSSTFRQKPWSRAVVHALLIVGSLVFIFPVLWMLSTSLKPIEQTLTPEPVWIPRPIQWRNYVATIEYIPFVRYALNTVFVCTLATVGTTLSSALVAFSFTRLEWPGRNLLFGLTLATMMVPFPVVMVPLYSVYRTLGWIGQPEAALGAHLLRKRLQHLSLASVLHPHSEEPAGGHDPRRRLGAPDLLADVPAALQSAARGRRVLSAHVLLERPPGAPPLPHRPEHVHAARWDFRRTRARKVEPSGTT